MMLVPIQVQCRSGFKADEKPTSFLCESSQIVVEEILDQWLQAGKDQHQAKADYFKVQGNDNHKYLLKHDLDLDQWFLENRW